MKVYSTGVFFIKLNERHLSLEDCDLKTQHMAFDLLKSMFSVLILKEIPHDGYKHDKICVKVNGAKKRPFFSCKHNPISSCTDTLWT